MLEELQIRDLGVIAEATLPLGPGFTAVTGETGAGKTMVVTALGLVLGARSDASAVRSGAKQAWVSGRWLVPEQGPVAERVHDAGGDLDGPELLLARSVSAEGRGRAVVGGRSAPVSVLSELADQLVVVHGQSDQIRLRSAAAQREALDRFGGPGLADALRDYASAFERWRANREELDSLTEARETRAREAERLRSALAEIEVVAPQRGEDVELAAQSARLGSIEQLRLAAGEAREAISSEELDGRDALGLLETARRVLERAAEHDAALQPTVQTLGEAAVLLVDAAGGLSSYLAELDLDGAHDLELIENRRAELSLLARTYGPTLDDVLDLVDSSGLRLLELDGDDERIAALEADTAADADLVDRLATRLTELRTAAAAELGERVSDELTALAMADARLHVKVTAAGEPSVHGRDSVEMLLQPHTGAAPRPLARGASGGELSRVMLAIEVVVAANDPVPTFVFDEVDAGVGGAAAIEIGRRLARLAETSQVIVVTHLAQVAAFATNHLRVEKGSDGAVTSSAVTQLDSEERVSEMARLLSGLTDSANALAHARELLESSRRG
ncbi:MULTISPECIES: DNA repair protein RecN [unclassified Rathayibacter]|jgi:DNA repair protein RecN (Recombination protein N)|uniref:DNA repair protein RecN n=1 Tax=unclassified Rathayibacter TaxID=2609250 RepID=UPI000CE835F2|nr:MULTISPECIES: DNA repair protein RecN [unclassified Rathayibacter]PPF19268.1 DNA repair protein RecN [Rathayibacter sp. AY1A7]PPG19748.1 DNA repair protein RecN [Rathayibacter sp. AY1E8]PPG28463.1 DNA repair protein RecN [Rathayibacter sp. AY2B9]PPG62651.1 DNA repair protein RecN [Rathayibacter sp. AY2B7]PPG82389.1 DNA repair protein RecN [Rathayibacter sp. AY1E5]